MSTEGTAGEGIDEMLDEALNKDLHSVFQPNTDYLAKAVIKFIMIHMDIAMRRLTTEKEDHVLHIAMNVILVHLEYAYPEFRRKLAGR